MHAAALRELHEEAGILATDLTYRGRVVFGALEGSGAQATQPDIRLFSVTRWTGDLTA